MVLVLSSRDLSCVLFCSSPCINWSVCVCFSELYILSKLVFVLSCPVHVQAEIYAEIGEIISESKPLPKVPDCGKKYYLFKSLGMQVK